LEDQNLFLFKETVPFASALKIVVQFLKIVESMFGRIGNLLQSPSSFWMTEHCPLLV
jgi:hypothetical protein